MKLAGTLAAASVLLLSSCMVGPNYQRPKVNVPATYRGEPPNEAGNQNTASLGDEKWWAVFHDQQLQELIRTALQQNYNVRIAASRVLQQRAQVVITRADEFPTLAAGPALIGERSPAVPGVFGGFQYLAPELTASASWNPDFWGRYRRATEAARANLLSAEWNRRAVISTLVSNVATAYFQLRELDLELGIARRTLASREESLRLTQTLESGGATSMEDVRQAQQLVETAAGAIPDTERQIQQQENQISILLGENPAEIARGRKLTEEEPLPPSVPPGLPSSLVERRPDIRQAEQQLIAANAEIGVARAQFFPQISLTGSAGFESIGLHNLFAAADTIWNFTAGATQPIFEGGRLRGNLQLAEAQDQQMLLTYKQTIQQAFSDVSNALIAYQKYRQYREHQELLARYAQDAANLSDMRYKGGVTSYLEVLTSQTNYFSAELTLARARLSERLTLVQTYNALGGGWQQ